MDENFIYFYSVTFVFSILLIAAAIFDVWKYVIPNFVSVGIVVLFFVASLLIPFQTYWLSHLGTASATFVVGLIVYRFRLMGAGDIKLITAVSLWTGVGNIASFLSGSLESMYLSGWRLPAAAESLASSTSSLKVSSSMLWSW